MVVNDENPATKQLVQAYNKIGCSIMGVQRVPHEEVYKYGIVHPAESQRFNGDSRMVKLTGMVESHGLMKHLQIWLLWEDMYLHLKFLKC